MYLYCTYNYVHKRRFTNINLMLSGLIAEKPTEKNDMASGDGNYRVFDIVAIFLIPVLFIYTVHVLNLIPFKIIHLIGGKIVFILN